MKELYLAAHEELIDEFLEAHPGADWSEAYVATSDGASERALDRLCDQADAAKDRAKDRAR